MTPQTLAASLRRVCEIADLAAQNGVQFAEDDDLHLTRLERLANILDARTTPPVVPEPGARQRRPIKLDTPEDVAGVDVLIEGAKKVVEWRCNTCRDTDFVFRTNRKGKVVQTTERCAVCSAEETAGDKYSIDDDEWYDVEYPDDPYGVTSAEEARRLAERLLRNANQPLNDHDPFTNPRSDGVAISVNGEPTVYYPGDRLSREAQIQMGRMSLDGGSFALRRRARAILEAQPPEYETWSFGAGVSVELGDPLNLAQLTVLENVANSLNNAYSSAQIAKARRFLAAAPSFLRETP